MTFSFLQTSTCFMWLPRWLSSKESACQCRRTGYAGSIPGLGRSPGGNGNPLQYSCWENSMDRGASWATVHGVAQELDRTERVCVHACMHAHTCTRTHTWTLPPFLSLSRDSLAIKRMVSFPVGILFSKGDFLLFKYTLMQTGSCQHLESHPVASCPAPLSVKLWCRHFRGKSHLSVSLVKWFLSWSLKSSPSAHCCPSTVFHMQISTVRGV